MKAIVSVIGQDNLGIIAKVSGFLYSLNINVLDVSQSILRNYFNMIMLVDMSKCKEKIYEVAAKLDTLGQEISMNIRIQHEDIFNTMHKI